MTPTPLMIVSDAPSSRSGLGRITRELAERIYWRLSETFCVATLGYGGVGSRKLPWQQYAIGGDPAARQWQLPELYLAWEDFAGTERGVVLTIWDASRMGWLVNPTNPTLKDWIKDPPFQLWGYWPVDAEGTHGKLPYDCAPIMRRFDRNLAYSQWAEELMAKDDVRAQSLPHGIDCSIWYPRDRVKARNRCRQMGLKMLRDESILIGVVATNQSRKDWSLAFETCYELRKLGKDVLIWCHIDAVQRHWNLTALAKDFDMMNRVLVTQPVASDEDLAELYSACDVTLGIGLGEGWGMILAESMACGVPVVHGNYGGGAEFLPKEYLVEPAMYRYEGVCRRPVFRPTDWAEKVLQIIGSIPVVPEYIKWENAWPRWAAWLTEGVECKS